MKQGDCEFEKENWFLNIFWCFQSGTFNVHLLCFIVIYLECPLFRQKNSGGIFFDGIHDTEYGIPAEFRKNSVSTEYIYSYLSPPTSLFNSPTDYKYYTPL